MTELNTVSPAIDPKKPHKQDSSSHSKEKDVPSTLDPMLLAYLMIFHTVELGRQTAQIQSKELQVNGVQQNRLIDLEAKKKIQTFGKSLMLKHEDVVNADGGPSGWMWVLKTTKSWKDGQAKFDAAQLYNQGVTSVRSVFEGQINVLKQNGQYIETNVNTSISDSEQAMQEGSSLMTMLLSITQRIES